MGPWKCVVGSRGVPGFLKSGRCLAVVGGDRDSDHGSDGRAEVGDRGFRMGLWLLRDDTFVKPLLSLRIAPASRGRRGDRCDGAPCRDVH